MRYRDMLKQIVTRQRPLIDVWHYLVGNYRYKLYYSRKQEMKNMNMLIFITTGKATLNKVPPKHKLMRQHIWEQIAYRISVMNRKCYTSGSCTKCGCDTTHLQMCNKPCEGLEYPPMMNARNWGKFLEGRYIARYKEYVWLYLRVQKSLSILKETSTGYVPINNN